VQMPRGVPVATVAIDGARNAGLLAARILAVADPDLGRRLDAARAELAEAAHQADARVRQTTPPPGGPDHAAP
jgi:5-(carboxyamino)imidazole ribonucleotide mutase